jgi:hypothetical protein
VTIRRGAAWGEAVAVRADLRRVHTDAELHDVLDAWRHGRGQLPPIGLAGGDLARTVAGGGADQFTTAATRLTLDLVRIDADGRTTWSAAHVVCRRSWWRGEVVVAMTAQHLDGFDVAPRAHPNDGRLDLLRVEPGMRARARWQARRRARTGTHLPHPGLHPSQVAEIELTFVRPLHVWVDGRRWHTAAAVSLTVEADAYVAYV